jgi:hypothetical protein
MVLNIAIIHLIRLIDPVSVGFLSQLPGISQLPGGNWFDRCPDRPTTAWGLWRGHPLARKAMRVLTAICDLLLAGALCFHHCRQPDELAFSTSHLAW